jgi:MFS transporter, DHA2 family, multidrug resistance protein
MEAEYYHGPKLLLLNIALGLGTFIQVLDISIANVAIPYIAGNLSVSADEGTWVITSFSASNAIVLPLTGWLSDYFGRVRLFVYSLLLFSFASFLCGFSTSLTMLVICRVLQGAVAGSLIPLSQSLLLLSNPPDKQGSALGFWGMIVIVAPVLGPILGGYITQEYSWPWIFYINVPIGIFAAAATWFFLKERESKIVRNPIDWFGLFLLSVAVASIQIMLDQGKDLDWFESNAIIALTCAAAVCLTLFCVWNYFEKYPIVDFSIFKDRNFSVGTFITTVGYLIFFGSTVIVPLWLQTVQDYTPLWAGVAVAPVGFFPILFSAYLGKNLYRFDLRALASFSFFFFAISFLYQSHFTTEVDLQVLIIARMLQGLGVVIFFIPLTQITLGNIPPAKYASASGIFNFIRILVGSGFGTSLAIEFWTRWEIYYHSRLTEAATLYNPNTVEFYQMMEAAGPEYSPEVIHRLLDRGIEQQAYMLSTNFLSELAVFAFILLIPIPFLCKVVKNKKMGPAASE